MSKLESAGGPPGWVEAVGEPSRLLYCFSLGNVDVVATWDDELPVKTNVEVNPRRYFLALE